MRDFFLRNEVIWLFYIVINYLFVLFAYKKWGKIGVMIFVPISIIIANIQVSKFVVLFGLETTLGNIAYGTVFLVDDILSENYGKKYAKQVIGIGFLTMIFTTIVMNIAISFKPADIDVNHIHIKALFDNFSIVTVASLIAYCCSSMLDIYLYQAIRNVFPGFKSLWLRNNLSTIISQIADNAIFHLIAFHNQDFRIILTFMFSTYFLKLIISVADTPFIYIAAWWKKKGKINELY